MYTEQNHSHGQRREFRIQNNAQKAKEINAKMIFFSLAYLKPIKLLFCVSTGENFLKKKKKKKIKIGQKPFYIQVNYKEW